jgi:hypothetical protein
MFTTATACVKDGVLATLIKVAKQNVLCRRFILLITGRVISEKHAKEYDEQEEELDTQQMSIKHDRHDRRVLSASPILPVPQLLVSYTELCS